MLSLRLAAFAGALAFTTAAAAQPPQEDDGWRFTVGGGTLLSPAYEGDDDYRLSLLPYIKIEYGDRFVASVQDGVSYAIVDAEGFRVGPIARIRFSRDEDGSQPFAVTGERSGDLIGLGDIDTTIEIGGFLEYELVENLTAKVELRQGVNGHEGMIGEAGLTYGGRSFVLGPPIIYSIGPRVTFVGDGFNDAYFGVTTAQSIASGLPVYDPDGGLYSFGLGATAIFPLTRDNRWAAVAIASYQRLTGDAGDSPLVQLRGAQDQAVAGLFLTYRLW